MKYEKRNNLGLIYAVVGSLVALGGLLFFPLGSALSLVSILGGGALAAVGFYYMTRGFTPGVDDDHPDFKRWYGKEEESDA